MFLCNVSQLNSPPAAICPVGEKHTPHRHYMGWGNQKNGIKEGLPLLSPFSCTSPSFSSIYVLKTMGDPVL